MSPSLFPCPLYKIAFYQSQKCQGAKCGQGGGHIRPSRLASSPSPSSSPRETERKRRGEKSGTLRFRFQRCPFLCSLFSFRLFPPPQSPPVFPVLNSRCGLISRRSLSVILLLGSTENGPHQKCKSPPGKEKKRKKHSRKNNSLPSFSLFEITLTPNIFHRVSSVLPVDSFPPFPMSRRENAVDLAKFVDKGVRVKLSGGREGKREK